MMLLRLYQHDLELVELLNNRYDLQSAHGVGGYNFWAKTVT